MKTKRMGRKLLCLIVSLVMILTLIPRTSMDLAYAAAGDPPEHNKTAEPNGDGTYKL